jgi:beta-lactamase class A
MSRAPAPAAAAAVALAVLTACGADSPSPEPTQDPSATGATSPGADGEPDRAGGLPPRLLEALVSLEEQYDARLGVFAVDTGSGATVAHRADERFAYASTFKALAAAAVLDRTGPAELEEVIRYDASDLVTYSPVTELHVETGLSLRRVAEAAVRLSDNTAANLLLDALGGPDGFERALRQVGDDVTVAAREETELNTATPGDRRDTSTPRAFASALEAYVVDGALARADRDLLLRWMRGNATGDTLVEAGLPDSWRVADKSGTAAYGTRNDIAVVHPPGGAPIVIAVFSDRDLPDAEHDDALVADAARVVGRRLG